MCLCVLQYKTWWFNFYISSHSFRHTPQNYYRCKEKKLPNPYCVSVIQVQRKTESSSSNQKVLFLTACTTTKFKSAVLNNLQKHSPLPSTHTQRLTMPSKTRLISFTYLLVYQQTEFVSHVEACAPPPTCAHIWKDPLQKQLEWKLVCIYIYRII